MGRAKHLDCDNAICDRTGATFLENLWIIDWNIFKRDGQQDVYMEWKKRPRRIIFIGIHEKEKGVEKIEEGEEEKEK